MGERIRSFDWSATSLGPPENWPQSLKTSIRIMLMSRQPVWIGWGKDLFYFYNDPYFSIIGGKHPWALGRPTREVWHEIWDVIGPMLATAMSGDEGTYVESQLLIMERNGYPEETYYTFSYSPIPDDEGRPGGIFCANSDDTQRVIGQRELALLRELAARTAKSNSPREACERSISALATNPWDLPFAAIYLVDEVDGLARLHGTSGIAAGHRLVPETVALEDSTFAFEKVLRDQSAQVLTDLGHGDDLPRGAWPVPPTAAIALPLAAAGETSRGGILVVGLSPYRLLTETYEGFLNLVSGQVAAAISDAEAIERERLRMEAMAELDRAKTAFFANVSHEFRTPLTLMLGPLEDVLSHDLGGVPPRVHLELETVHRNGLRLQKLVNTLLDFSRLEAGRMRAEFRPTDLSAFTAELASSFRSAMEKAGLRYTVDCPVLALEDFAYIDRDLWEKVVLNLISNAFKHTFEGGVRVSVRKERGAIELSVADSGVGISPEDLAHIFERFRRVEGSKSRTHEGSGIGLALVQEIVRLHGGEISASSETEGPDRGTTFTVRIPLGSAHLPSSQVVEEVAPAAIRSAEAVVGEAMRWLPESSEVIESLPEESLSVSMQTSGARILVVDDNADMRNYIVRLLSPSYGIEAAEDGEAALEAIRKRGPDLVITDVMMPRLDGFGLLKAIREDADLAHVPVIMLSARAGEEARIEGLDAGADDYLVKPFSARELLARVDSALALANLRREASEAQVRSEERLQMALSAARMVAWQWNPETDTMAASENVATIFGLLEETDITRGTTFSELVHPEDLQKHIGAVLRAFAEGGSYQSQFRLIRPIDGQMLWMEERGKVALDPDQQPHMIGVVMDITERKRVEQERSDAEALLAAEKRVLESIMTDTPLGNVLENLTRETEALSRDGMMCSILLLDESGTRLLHGAAPSLPTEYNEAIHGLTIGPNVGSCGTAAHEQRPANVSDIENDPRWSDFKDLASRFGLRSCSSRPIVSSQGALLGTVAMYYREARTPSEHDEELIGRAARLAGVVIERDRALAAAESERTRLQDLFTRAPAVICVLKGPKHVFDLANPLYVRLVGRSSASELLRRPIRQVLPELEGQGFFEILDRVYETGEPFFGKEMLVQLERNGSEELEDVYMNFVYLASKNVEGETDGILVHAVDVTEQVYARRRIEDLAQELEARVQQRTSELLSANEQLQGFTYSVAHDLRQQIRGISTNAALVVEEAGDGLKEQSKYHLSRLIRSARQLAELVDDLLSYAKLGKASPTATTVDLSKMAREVVGYLREHGQCPPTTEVVVEGTPTAVGDLSMLRIVLENLLDNACKYSHKNPHAVIEFGADEKGYFVRDNGVGFDMAFAHKLFEPFERLHGDDTYRGTGIGLANVRRIVEKHGGKVWAESEPGKGATFRFTLP